MASTGNQWLAVGFWEVQLALGMKFVGVSACRSTACPPLTIAKTETVVCPDWCMTVGP